MGGEFVVDELWVFPVKGCKGLAVQEAVVTSAGLALDLGGGELVADRGLVVVDGLGLRFPAFQAISPRQLPALLKVSTRLRGSTLVVSAPGMSRELEVALAGAAAREGARVRVDCSDKKRLEGNADGSNANAPAGGWALGSLEGTVVGGGAAEWFSELLAGAQGGQAREEGAPPTRFELVRADGARRLSEFPPAFPILEAAATDARFRHAEAKFSDFGPLLVANRSSMRLVEGVLGKEYPIGAFRANIVVAPEGEGEGEPWAEERWLRYRIGETHLQSIKGCPRCTMTLRDPRTGEWVFSADKLALHKVLKGLFPLKAEDPEWGSWRGVIFGVFTGFADKPAPGQIMRRGQRVEVESLLPEEEARQRAPAAPARDAKPAPGEPQGWLRANKRVLLVLALLLLVWRARRVVRALLAHDW
jgi:uncharacterized protein YcbX